MGRLDRVHGSPESAEEPSFRQVRRALPWGPRHRLRHHTTNSASPAFHPRRDSSGLCGKLERALEDDGRDLGPGLALWLRDEGAAYAHHDERELWV